MSSAAYPKIESIGWQFSLRSMLLLVVYAALLLAWLRWLDNDFFRFYPGPWGCIFALVPLVAAIQLRHRAGCDSAWNLIAVGGLAALANLSQGIIDSFETFGGIPTRAMYQQAIEGAVISAITLPLVLTLPCLFALLVYYRSLPTGTSRWILYSLGLAFLDGLLLVVLASIAFGTWHI